MLKLTISDDFRASMNWLHTWAGVAVSCLLFKIFWMGSLSVFDREIDQWMKPEMRIEAPVDDFRYGPVFKQFLNGEAKGAERIFVSAPGERDPLGTFFYKKLDEEGVRGYFNSATNEVVELTHPSQNCEGLLHVSAEKSDQAIKPGPTQYVEPCGAAAPRTVSAYGIDDFCRGLFPVVFYRGG